jgi:hypothetical protein
MGGMNPDIMLGLLNRQLHDPAAKGTGFTHYIDSLLVAAVANPDTDTIEGIIHDLNYAKAEIEKAIAALKKVEKSS